MEAASDRADALTESLHGAMNGLVRDGQAVESGLLRAFALLGLFGAAEANDDTSRLLDALRTECGALLPHLQAVAIYCSDLATALDDLLR